MLPRWLVFMSVWALVRTGCTASRQITHSRVSLVRCSDVSSYSAGTIGISSFVDCSNYELTAFLSPDKTSHQARTASAAAEIPLRSSVRQAVRSDRSKQSLRCSVLVRVIMDSFAHSMTWCCGRSSSTTSVQVRRRSVKYAKGLLLHPDLHKDIACHASSFADQLC